MQAGVSSFKIGPRLATPATPCSLVTSAMASCFQTIRLARALLPLANFNKGGGCVMNKFSALGLIEHNGDVKAPSAFVNIVVHN